MVHVLWIFLLVLLIASWALFIRYYRALGSGQDQTSRKFEDQRRQIMEQFASMGVFTELLAGIHEFVSGNPDPESKKSLYKMILDAACQIMKCPSGSLMMADKDGAELEIVASKGLSEPQQAMRLKFGDGVAGRAAAQGKPVVVDNIDTDARFVGKKELEVRLKSLVSVPLKIKSRVIGVINTDFPDAHRAFHDRDIELLTVLANLSAIAIENLDLYSNLQLFYLEMVESMATSLEYKEFEAGVHPTADPSLNRNHARAIAQEMKLPESIVRYVEYAALIHAIGKIGIGETILRKPGKLTPEEYEKMKKHPEIAQQMISRVKFLSPILPMVLYHQERWDGKGYPAGLKGEEIPLGARIVMAVTAYSAMVTDRPYRQKLNLEDAIDELKRGSGTQFDPKVVDAFVKVLERGAALR